MRDDEYLTLLKSTIVRSDIKPIPGARAVGATLSALAPRLARREPRHVERLPRHADTLLHTLAHQLAHATRETERLGEDQ